MTDMRKAMLVEHMLDMEKNMTKAIKALEFMTGLEKEVRSEYPEINALGGDDREKFFKELLGKEVADRIEAVGEHLNDLLAGF